MKTIRTPALVLGLLYVCFLGYLALSAGHLPSPAATHFDASGQPNGWMSRGFLLVFMAVFAILVPLLQVGSVSLVRYVPDSLINLPHRGYWLAPERRQETFAYLQRWSLWLACGVVGFIWGVYLLILRANAQAPPRLSGELIFLLIGCFVLGLILWISALLRHFLRVA